MHTRLGSLSLLAMVVPCTAFAQNPPPLSAVDVFVGRPIGTAEAVPAPATVGNEEPPAPSPAVADPADSTAEGGAPRGTMSSTAIAATFRRREGDIRRCYEASVLLNPSNTGRVEIQVEINMDARIEWVRLSENELGDEFGECLLAAIARWQFDEAPVGGSVWVQKAYILAPGSRPPPQEE